MESYEMSKYTPGPWRLGKDANGPCMIMHPQKSGVAIASLTGKGMPKNGFLEQQDGEDEEVSLAERGANARLIATVPDLFEAAMAVIAAAKSANANIGEWPAPLQNLLRAVAKAEAMG